MSAELSRCETCGVSAPDPNARFCPHDGTPLVGGTPWRDPLVGTTLDGRYKILLRVGEGGFAVVYHARHERFGTDVALKLLRPEFANDAGILARFAAEARTTGMIDHDNVVRVMDVGCAAGSVHYIATEYVPGTSLGDELATVGSLPPLRAAHVAAQIAAGVGRAHELGIVHRDLKPDNIMLLRRGSDADIVKILDFGIARAAREARTTRAGEVLGTPAYMAPEQWESRTIDARTDVYALGAMLLEMLTGDPPFEGTVAAQFIHHLQTPAPSPTSRSGSLRAGAVFDGIVARCLAKSPADRFQSMTEVLAALSQVWSSVGRPSGRLTYARTAAAPPSRIEAIPDATVYGSAPLDVVWDGGALCAEIRRLHLVRTRRLDDLVHVLWPTGLPRGAHELRELAQMTEDRIDAKGEELSLLEAQTEERWQRGREEEARLRLAVIDANIALAASRDRLARTGPADPESGAGATATDVLRAADQALASYHRRQQHAESSLRERLPKLIAALSALEREVQPIHEKLAALVRKEAGRRPELRDVVMAFAQIDGALAAHQSLLETFEPPSPA